MHYINRTYIIAATTAFLILNGCVTRDLEPIGGPILEGVSRGTDSDTATIGDTLPDSGPVNTDSDTTGTTDSNTEISQDTQSATASEFETDTTSGIIPGTATDSETGTEGDTETDTSSDSDSEADTETESETETGSDTGAIVAKKWVGSATQGGTYPDDFFELWNQVTPENAGKWGEIEKERDVMDWDAHDALYDMAKDKGIIFKAHTLIWHQQQPAWIDNLPPAAQREEVEEWIAAFCERYPEVDLMNVVTAPYHDPPSYNGALGGAGETGYDWVITAFEMARTHCPNTKLLFQQYNALIYQTWATVDVAEVLIARDLLDGIGCAATELIGMSRDDLIANLDTLMELHVPIYIAELTIQNNDGDVQRDLMRKIFPALYENPSVAGITFWGYVEGNTLSSSAFLRHADGRPRKALTWLQEEGYLVNTDTDE